MDEELYIISEEHGTGKIVSINEDENTATVEYEDGFEEDLDLDDEFNFDFDDEEEEAELDDEGEEEDVVEEGRGKRGSARQAGKCCDDDDDDYEKRGAKPSKGRFIMDRARKNQMQESAELVGLALDKKPTEFSAEFANVLQSRIADRIAELKVDIAKNLHKDSDIENS